MSDLLPPHIDPKALNPYIPTTEDLRVCPLCRRDWIKIEEEGADGKAYFACLFCEISIWVRDKCLGLWTRVEKEPCVVCGHKETRLFFRSDGYLKMYCPKCKMIVENVDEKKHNKVLTAEVKKGIRWMPKADLKRIQE